MFVIIGYLVVFFSVIGGFALAGGSLAALWQPLELLIIFGGAAGSFLVSNDPALLKATLIRLSSLLKADPVKHEHCEELLIFFFEIFSKTRKEGIMSVETDIDEPMKSPLFTKYKNLLANNLLLDFVRDYLRMMVSGNLNPFELESLMDSEIEALIMQEEMPVQAVARMGESLPAFGIVAAVMGVVNTMASVGSEPKVLGEMIAHALVGTFLGILLSYGFITPLSHLMEQRAHSKTRLLEVAKLVMVATAAGYPPVVAVEFGRKGIEWHERPSFEELEKRLKKGRNAR